MVSAAARKNRAAPVRDDAPETPRTRRSRRQELDEARALVSEGNRLDYKPVNLKPLTVDVDRSAAKRTY